MCITIASLFHHHNYTHGCALQDPIIFSGSVRSNLDPWGVHDGHDAALWEALRRAGMEPAVRALEVRVALGGGGCSGGGVDYSCM